MNFKLSDPGHVIVKIHNVEGRLVREIDAGRRNTGRHKIRWDVKDTGGYPVAAGVYFISLRTDRVDLPAKVIRLE